MAFVADSDLESETGMRGMAYVEEYEDIFHEQEFVALGINPSSPTEAKPGSEDKVVMLAARYAAGLPLWHGSDRYDHGPDDFQTDDEEDDE